MDRFTELPLPPQTGISDAQGGRAQHFARAADVPGQWWDVFGSPSLALLVTEALAKNPSLAAAEASLRAARENTLAQQGALFPSASAQINRTREKLSPAESGVTGPIAGSPTTFSIYDAQVNVSYTFDIWGQARLGVEAARAQEEAQRFALQGARNMLAANTATAAITAASLSAQIAAEEALVTAEQNLLKTVRSQFELGGATGTDVATQESQLANTQALVVPLRIQLAQTRNQLAAYLGKAPAEASIPALTLASLTLPETVPVSLPSKLVEQRPDIRNAEANLRAATDQIGIAIANRLPQLTLTGYLGSVPASAGNFFTPGNGVFELVTQAMMPIFQGGTLLHRQRQAVAAAEQAAATYRNTVITAFQNVADVLTALNGDAEALDANRRAEQAAARSLRLAQIQYGAGGVAYLTVLTAQTQYQNAVIGLIRAEAARFTDTVALFAALGGGWWNRDEVVP